MRVQIFDNGNIHDKRSIRIEVDNSFISFYFDTNDYEFYWISSQDWINHSKHLESNVPQIWRNHMKRKSWYTPAMEEFIDKCLSIKTN